MEYLILILTLNSAPGAVPPAKLAHAIIAYSKQYNVNPVLVAKIVMVESKGKETAKNKRSDDHGLMQINAKTAKAIGINQKCLYDWRCNLRHGVQILAKLKRPCQYNVGVSGIRRHGISRCLKYESKLASIK